ncbi:MAG: ABC transporter ATP-binding protein, partial [Planctomycetota bacterium]
MVGRRAQSELEGRAARCVGARAARAARRARLRLARLAARLVRRRRSRAAGRGAARGGLPARADVRRRGGAEVLRRSGGTAAAGSRLPPARKRLRGSRAPVLSGHARGGDAALSAPAVELAGLSRDYGARTALAPLSLAIGAGELVGLLGPNGSGKSTLLRMLVGLVRPTAGAARVAGVALRGDGLAVRRVASFAPGEIALYGELSARAHLDWLLRGRAREAYARAHSLAERLGLPLGARVRSFSHGMKRQLLLAAALAPDVPVRLLDEPTEGLDPTKRGEVLALLREDRAAGRTLVLSSHHLGEVDAVCTRLLFLSAGKLVADEDARALERRASALLRLRFPAGVGAERVAGELARAGLAPSRTWQVAGEDGQVWASCRLEAGDPRAAFARLATAELPAPTAVQHGRLSLAELYHE